MFAAKGYGLIRLLSCALFAGSLLWGTVGLASAEQVQASHWGDWHMVLTPHGWALRTEGDIRARDRKQDLDIKFADLLSNLDMGFEGSVELRNDRVGFVVTGIYGVVSDEQEQGPLDLDVEMTSVAVDFGALYRVLSTSVSSSFADRSTDRLGRGAGRLNIDLFLMGRYWYQKPDVKIRGPLENGPIGTARVDKSTEWVDPLLGTRLQVGLTDRLKFMLLGGVGGFGIGDASDFTWDAWAMWGYQVAERWTLQGGYRGLGIDRDGKDVNVDIIMHGPMIGVNILLF